MITTTITIHGRNGKQKEIVQTLTGLIEQMAGYGGCLRAELYRSLNDENTFYIIEEWSTNKDLKKYKNSRYMNVLLGLEVVLSESLQIDHAVKVAGCTCYRK